MTKAFDSKFTTKSVSTRRSLYIILGLIWILLMVLFGFYDLAISKAVVNPNDILGHFIEDYGEVPGFILIYFALSSILSEKEFGSRSSVILTIVMYIVNVLMFEDLLSRFTTHSILAELILGAVLTFLTLLVLELEHMDLSSYSSSGKRVLSTAVINPLLIVYVMKLLWGRTRFRYLGSNYMGYSPWYIPQGITGDRSFPSGHSAMAWLMLTAYYYVADKNLITRVSLILSVVLWGITVSWGRVVIGAHYASDVTFSAFTGIFVFLYFVSRDNNLLDKLD